MNILLVSPTPPPNGGIAIWTGNYIDYLSKEDSIFLVDTKLTGKRLININSKLGIIDEIKRTVRVFITLKHKLENIVNISHINSSCSMFGIVRDMVVVEIIKRKEIPVVFHCHCNIEDQIKSTLQRIVLKKICSNSKLIIVLNNKSLDYITSITDTKVIMIPNFINDGNKIKVSINDSINRIIYVGHVRKSKGSEIIIELAKLLPNIQFKLVGPVHKEISEFTIPDNVSIVGELKHDKIYGELLKSDVFIFPSKTEGFSISLLEAMDVGLPCIVSDVGANKDMIENKGGFVVNNNKISHYYNAIKYLEKKEIREECSKWNVEKVKKFYDKEEILKKIRKEYEGILHFNMDNKNS